MKIGGCIETLPVTFPKSILTLRGILAGVESRKNSLLQREPREEEVSGPLLLPFTYGGHTFTPIGEERARRNPPTCTCRLLDNRGCCTTRSNSRCH